MALVGQRYLMAIGGNDGKSVTLECYPIYIFCLVCVSGNLMDVFHLFFPGKRPLADVWALDTAAKPYEWRKLEPEGEGPPPCMYASISLNSAFLD